MISLARSLIKTGARRIGFDVVRHPGPATTAGRRMLRMRRHGIDLVVDVGANVGQFGLEMRALGYRGSLVSIEPLPAAYAELTRNAARDRAWETINCAIGREVGTATMHVAQNSVSSSLLPMLPEHLAAAPQSRFVGDVSVPVRTIDSIFGDVAAKAVRPFIKIDTQGFELEVLEGSTSTLKDVEGLQVEMSLEPLYEGAPTMTSVIDWVERHGFVLADVEPEFNDPQTGRLLQINGLFFRPRHDQR